MGNPASGRTLTVYRGASPQTAIARVQTKSVSINRSPVDITNDDSSGWRTLLDDVGTIEVNISVEGVAGATTIIDIATDPTAAQESLTLTWDDGSTLVGSFFIASYEESGTHDDAVQFSCEFQSSGTITYTAGP
jgi:TP901-1 family phage major tail protein